MENQMVREDPWLQLVKCHEGNHSKSSWHKENGPLEYRQRKLIKVRFFAKTTEKPGCDRGGFWRDSTIEITAKR